MGDLWDFSSADPKHNSGLFALNKEPKPAAIKLNQLVTILPQPPYPATPHDHHSQQHHHDKMLTRARTNMHMRAHTRTPPPPPLPLHTTPQTTHHTPHTTHQPNITKHATPLISHHTPHHTRTHSLSLTGTRLASLTGSVSALHSGMRNGIRGQTLTWVRMARSHSTATTESTTTLSPPVTRSELCLATPAPPPPPLYLPSQHFIASPSSLISQTYVPDPSSPLHPAPTPTLQHFSPQPPSRPLPYPPFPSSTQHLLNLLLRSLFPSDFREPPPPNPRESLT